MVSPFTLVIYQLASAGFRFKSFPSAARLLVNILIAKVSGQLGAMINEDLIVSLVWSTSGVPFTPVIFTINVKVPDCDAEDIYARLVDAGKEIMGSASAANVPVHMDVCIEESI